MRNCTLLPLLLVVLLLAGCSGNVGLTGKVVYSDDRSPLPKGTVCLVTDTHFSRGELQPDGTFTVGSVKTKDGLPPGQYRVYISGADEIIGQTAEGQDIYRSLIDAKYVAPETSGLTIDIQRTTKDFEIVVDRYGSAAKK